MIILNIYRQIRTGKIIDWTNMEYTLFRALEYARYGDIITKGFSDVDEFVKVANMVLNRRKEQSRKKS